MDIAFILINAITVAAIYGLIAVAVSITWSSLGLINLAYGFIYSLAGYAAWLVATQVAKQYIDPALQPIVIAATGIIAGAIGGIIVCLIVFIPLHDKPAFTSRGMIATLAISLIGSQLFLMVFGPTAKSLPELFGRWRVKVFDITLSADKIGIVVCSIVMLVIVVLWMRSSRRGLEIRAMMMNPLAASIVGIGIRRTGLYVMALTGAMAGLASVLLSQTYYIAPFSGLTPLIKGVSIALCGGLGSVQGAVIAAILLGLVEALTNKFLGGQYVLMTQFLVIILVLIVRPRGIAGLLDKAREQ
jgi:branched-chain amino acid transport system permease protein